MNSRFAVAQALFLWLTPLLSRGQQVVHSFICTDYDGNKVSVVSTNGTVAWSYQCNHPQDCWRLENGNYLFCYEAGAREVTPAKETVWEYKPGPNTQVHACQPLPEGRVSLDILRTSVFTQAA